MAQPELAAEQPVVAGQALKAAQEKGPVAERARQQVSEYRLIEFLVAYHQYSMSGVNENAFLALGDRLKVEGLLFSWKL